MEQSFAPTCSVACAWQDMPDNPLSLGLPLFAPRQQTKAQPCTRSHQKWPVLSILPASSRTSAYAYGHLSGCNSFTRFLGFILAMTFGFAVSRFEGRQEAFVGERIPPILWFVLFVISLLGMGEIGYQTALAGSNRTPVSLGLVIAFALLLYLIADLDRPLEGSLRVNQAAMSELRERLETT